MGTFSSLATSNIKLNPTSLLAVERCVVRDMLQVTDISKVQSAASSLQLSLRFPTSDPGHVLLQARCCFQWLPEVSFSFPINRSIGNMLTSPLLGASQAISRTSKFSTAHPASSSCPSLTDSVSHRIKCLVGEEWCTLDKFSNKKLEDLRKKMRKGHIDPADTGLICREHSEQPISELLCHGHCGKIKPLAAFSKNTRTKNKEYVG